MGSIAYALIAAALIVHLPAQAQDGGPDEPRLLVAPALQPIGEVSFKSVLGLMQSPGALPQLRHGSVALTDDWPAVLYATYQTTRGTASCTAALVGFKAMLTAAHCVPRSGRISFEFAGFDFETDCEKHPRYPADESADFALCKVRATTRFPNGVPFPAGSLFERISNEPMDLMLGDAGKNARHITLTGYGCISDIVRDAVVDGKFRTGATHFVETSNSKPGNRDAGLYAPSELNNLITNEDAEYANLCPGDSGGPAFAYGTNNRREIIGVNSRVLYKDSSKVDYGASLVSSTGGPDFWKWARDWARVRAMVSVCGVEGNGERCR